MQVSVIIPTYNHQAYIPKTLESVFAQSFTDYEVIVINDGSPDNTQEILKPWVETGKIRYFEQKNQGQSTARNRGIAEAKGEFIALLDDDDLWPSDKLEWQISALQSNPTAVLVYGKVTCIDDQGKPFIPIDNKDRPLTWLSASASGNVREKLIENNFIVSPGQCLIRKKALEELGNDPFDIKIQGGCDDWDLYLRLSLVGNFIYQDRQAIIYRLHHNNASRNWATMAWSHLTVERKLLKSEKEPKIRSKIKAQIIHNELMYVNTLRRDLRAKTLNEKGFRRFIVISRLVPLYRSLFLTLFWELRESLAAMKKRSSKS